MDNARDAAVRLLLKMDRDDAYSNLSLAEAPEQNRFPDGREQALFAALVYGVLERLVTLDYHLSLYLTAPLKKLHPKTLWILRVGAYQLLYLDKVPARAAVSEAVAQAKRMGVGFTASLINAVLRKVSQAGERLPDPSDEKAYLSVRYACPPPLLDHFLACYGRERTESILSAFLGRPALFLRLNPLRGGDIARLAADGVSAAPTDLENCVTAQGAGNVAALPSYREGLFHVQDRSSQLCCKLLGAKPGETVVDCCAAPGGKSFTVAQYMRNEGVLYANDLYEHRRGLIEAGAARLGLTCIRTLCGDAAALPDLIPAADRVLCDAPCSGLGVIGRKPEIRAKTPASFAALPELQYGLLKRCSAMVKPGGTLLYSTCTLNPAENEDVCDRFLASSPGFFASDDPYYASLRGEARYITFFPEPAGGDGFFVALFRRNER